MNTPENSEQPQTVDEARDAVERSRERISRTLDRLEDRIVEKKHELEDRADVLRPVKKQVRVRPLTAIAVGFGVGIVLGSIGGREQRRSRKHTLDRDERRDLREWRAQRHDRLRARTDRHPSAADHDEPHASRLDGVKGQLVGAITSALAAAIATGVKDLVRDRKSDRNDARA